MPCRLIALFVLSLMVASCALPQPFRTTEAARAQNVQLDLGARSQLLVTPIMGMPGPEGARVFTDLVVGSLRARDVPAFALSPGGSVPLLTGRAIEAPGPDGSFLITFEWTLLDPSGLSSREFSTQHDVPGIAWLERDYDMFVGLARAVAVDIEQALLPESSIAQLQGVYIEAPQTLPGDGNASLPAALANILEAQGVNLVDRRDEAAVEVRFSGGVSPLPDGNDLVVLVWQVFHVGGDLDGVEIGQIDLANPVPPSMTLGPWRDLAEAAASGSAEGILELLVQAGII